MAKAKDINDPASVDAHIQQLDPEIGKCVEAIRKIILGADKSVGEQIKWNSPSFFYTGEMKPFDPKEYKRDIAVCNLHKGRIMIVFPTGAKVDDPSGLLEGDFKDGRKTATFKDLKDIETRKKDLQGVVKKWLALVE